MVPTRRRAVVVAGGERPRAVIEARGVTVPACPALRGSVQANVWGEEAAAGTRPRVAARVVASYEPG